MHRSPPLLEHLLSRRPAPRGPVPVQNEAFVPPVESAEEKPIARKRLPIPVPNTALDPDAESSK